MEEENEHLIDEAVDELADFLPNVRSIRFKKVSFIASKPSKLEELMVSDEVSNVNYDEIILFADKHCEQIIKLEFAFSEIDLIYGLIKISRFVNLKTLPLRLDYELYYRKTGWFSTEFKLLAKEHTKKLIF